MRQLAFIVMLLWVMLFRSALLDVAPAGAENAVAERHATRPALEAIKGEEVAVMTAAPNVPPPITRRHPTKVRLNIEVREHTKTLADGVSYTFWTFGDDTPGNFIRVRVGDLVETHLSNHPDNSVAHNIDFHAASGPGGGGEASFVAPGHAVTFSWRALAPGLYLYHCVAAPAGLHIANGMYGLILVEPQEGMPKVDQEYFIVQGEFYTDAPFGTRGKRNFSLEKALQERPDYVVFNGQVGALMGEKALRAKAGESIRLYLGNAGPSLLSSFHIVGEIFDNVYGEGGSKINQHNVQTTIVPVGGAAMVEFVAEVPGSYQMVDHSMFRAFNKGAMGGLEIEGAARPDVFSDRTGQGPYQPGTRLRGVSVANHATAASGAATRAAGQDMRASALLDHGKQVYERVCTACHQMDAQGLAGVIPPLAGSDFLMADADRAVRVLLQGLSGPIIVNGKRYEGVMPKLPLGDRDIAGVLSYVRSHFGNRGALIKPEEVRRVRAALAASGNGSRQVAGDKD
jgi:nitrite reductase (NO-forming)